MATLGRFMRAQDGGFCGEIVTLSVQAKNVRIIPGSGGKKARAPSYRVFVGDAEIGAGWDRRSDEGAEYIELQLDDPSFNAPICANLIQDEGTGTYSLIWSRPGRRRT